MATRAPALLLGHGSPMNAVADNPFTHSLSDLRNRLGAPRALLVVSAHWVTRGFFVASAARHRTQHDFGGFPESLYGIQWNAPGDPELAERVAVLLEDAGLGPVGRDPGWALDHGVWSPLRHIWAAADVPVVELSLSLPHREAGLESAAAALASLRDEGVVLVTSGNVVHNLGRVAWHEPWPPPESWAHDFDVWTTERVLAGDSLADWRSAPGAQESHPTPEHFWPFVFGAALRQETEPVTEIFGGFEHGNLSMRSWILG